MPRLHAVDIGWPVLHENVIITVDCFFPRLFYQKYEWKEFVLQGFSCSCAITKFRTGTICRILNYSAELGSYLLRIENKSVIFSRSKKIPQRNSMLFQENMKIFTRTPNFAVHFARVLWVCPPRLYSRTSQYPTQKGKLLKSIEAVAQRCSKRKVFLEISQNSQESTCARVCRPATLLKKTLCTGVFLRILRNFSEYIFLQNTSGGCF